MASIKIEELKGIKGVGVGIIDKIYEHLRNKEVEENGIILPKIDEIEDVIAGKSEGAIVCGSNTDVLRTIDDGKIDLTVTSPPYDDLRSYEGYELNVEKLIKELFRVTKEGGTVVWIVGDATIDGSETGSSFRQALKFKDVGFHLNDTMIYQKNTSSFPSKRKDKRYTQIFEYMFVFTKGKPKDFNLIADKKNKRAGEINWGSNTARGKDGKLVEQSDIKTVPEYSPRNNVWEYIVGGGFGSTDEEAYEHPAIFPEKLAEDHIKSWSKEGDIVLDPMVGSGTTAKMAKLNNRRYIGIDISKKYCELSKERLEKY